MHVDGVSGLHHGYVTQSLNGITNHIEIIPARTRGTPLAVFASNDKHVRILDCATNQFIAEHSLEARAAVNCAATSSDGRLRVLVGDSPEAWVVEAETGRPVQPLTTGARGRGEKRLAQTSACRRGAWTGSPGP